ncbi:hypothetical protein GCM10010421_22000 [Streptomyces glaucus]|uniref:Uncharacterized protein n=1 Tax=Streptomyces glaucus TaxID=284029 RepID=A0ABP5WPP9_9ACTN
MPPRHGPTGTAARRGRARRVLDPRPERPRTAGFRPCGRVLACPRYDTDRLYEGMCRSQPVVRRKDRWEALFPHLEHRESCAQEE